MTATVKGTARCPEGTFFDEKINLAEFPTFLPARLG